MSGWHLRRITGTQECHTHKDTYLCVPGTHRFDFWGTLGDHINATSSTNLIPHSYSNVWQYLGEFGLL